jgi:hypothetical protein
MEIQVNEKNPQNEESIEYESADELSDEENEATVEENQEGKIK